MNTNAPAHATNTNPQNNLTRSPLLMIVIVVIVCASIAAFLFLQGL